MNIKIPGNKSYAVGTVSTALGASAVIPENIADIPLPTTIEGACALILTVIGLAVVFLRQAIAKLTPPTPPAP